ncbi:MAG: ankyrin repeat domain-containing protein, partial [Armatimonadota bacterium]|nr:ankyrin repeat domain-containing protein [Armatimonadota bacterium]
NNGLKRVAMSHIEMKAVPRNRWQSWLLPWLLVLVLFIPLRFLAIRNRTNALISAVHAGDAWTAQQLIARGANVNARDSSNETLLRVAITNWDKNMIDVLVHGGASHDASTDLFIAALKNRVADARKAIANGADVNVRNGEGDSVLAYAAHCGHLTITKMLIEHGADINAKSKDGETPLMMAAFHGAASAVKLLIEAGADVNAKNKGGASALDIARASPGQIDHHVYNCSPALTVQLLKKAMAKSKAAPGLKSPGY